MRLAIEEVCLICLSIIFSGSAVLPECYHLFQFVFQVLLLSLGIHTYILIQLFRSINSARNLGNSLLHDCTSNRVHIQEETEKFF